MERQPLILRNGDGEALGVMGSQVRLICPSERTARQFSLMECAAPRDVGPPPHQHPWDEAYYILEGQFRFTLDDRELLLGPGDFLYVPAGRLHGFHGASDTTARLLFFDAPAHGEGFFRDAAREVREIPQDLSRVPEIGQRHGIQFAPPPAK
jgi:quercetin dioxygenase-like cupin family protein